MDKNENYDYQYSFSVKDEIVSRYSHLSENRLAKIFLFETETLFIINKTDGERETIGSETYDSIVRRIYDNIPKRKQMMTRELHRRMSYRFRDYGVGPAFFDRFDSDAVDFATRTEADRKYTFRSVVPIHVKVEVVTVQRQGETIEEARDRAVGPQVLIPIHVYPRKRGRTFDSCRSFFLVQILRKVRVGDVIDKGLILQVCGICSRLPNIGTRITTLPGCKHVFHSHCIVRWLLENDVCPTCNSVAYAPTMLNRSQPRQLSLSKLNLE